MAYFVDKSTPDGYVACPYNSSHMVKPNRLIYHMAKCPRQASFPERLTCPYNAKHRLLPHEMLDHIGECKSMVPGVLSESEIAEYKKYFDAAKEQAMVRAEQDEDTFESDLQEEDEDWDRDYQTATSSELKNDGWDAVGPSQVQVTNYQVSDSRVDRYGDFEDGSDSDDELDIVYPTKPPEKSPSKSPPRSRVNHARANYRNVLAKLPRHS